MTQIILLLSALFLGARNGLSWRMRSPAGGTMPFTALNSMNKLRSSSNLMLSDCSLKLASFNRPHLSSRLRSSSAEAEMYIPSSRVDDRALRPKDIKLLRAGQALRDELIDIIFRGEIRARASPSAILLRSITVTEVVPSSDLSSARVCVAIPGNAVERRKVFVWLCENIGQLRFALSRRLRHWRRVPKITFRTVDPNCISDVLAGEADFNQAGDEDEELIDESNGGKSLERGLFSKDRGAKTSRLGDEFDEGSDENSEEDNEDDDSYDEEDDEDEEEEGDSSDYGDEEDPSDDSYSDDDSSNEDYDEEEDGEEGQEDGDGYGEGGFDEEYDEKEEYERKDSANGLDNE